jgi:hypothetical protein
VIASYYESIAIVLRKPGETTSGDTTEVAVARRAREEAGRDGRPADDVDGDGGRDQQAQGHRHAQRSALARASR